MKYELLIADEAYWDIKDAVEYYKKIHPENLSVRFKKSLLDSFSYIQKQPLTLSIKYKQTRICSLKSFPYQIHFLVKKKPVLVFAVFHEKMNPKRWGKRLKD